MGFSLHEIGEKDVDSILVNMLTGKLKSIDVFCEVRGFYI